MNENKKYIGKPINLKDSLSNKIIDFSSRKNSSPTVGKNSPVATSEANIYGLYVPIHSKFLTSSYTFFRGNIKSQPVPKKQSTRYNSNEHRTPSPLKLGVTTASSFFRRQTSSPGRLSSLESSFKISQRLRPLNIFQHEKKPEDNRFRLLTNTNRMADILYKQKSEISEKLKVFSEKRKKNTITSQGTAINEALFSERAYGFDNIFKEPHVTLNVSMKSGFEKSLQQSPKSYQKVEGKTSEKNIDLLKMVEVLPLIKQIDLVASKPKRKKRSYKKIAVNNQVALTINTQNNDSPVNTGKLVDMGTETDGKKVKDYLLAEKNRSSSYLEDGEPPEPWSIHASEEENTCF